MDGWTRGLGRSTSCLRIIQKRKCKVRPAVLERVRCGAHKAPAVAGQQTQGSGRKSIGWVTCIDKIAADFVDSSCLNVTQPRM